MQLRRGVPSETADGEEEEPAKPGTQEVNRDGDSSNALQAELESIVNGTHPGLASELSKHTKLRDERVAAAQARLDEELRNINEIAECDDKMADDMCAEALEEVRERLCDAIYAKYGKMNPNLPPPLPVDLVGRKERKRVPLQSAPWAGGGAQRRRLLPPVQIRYGLSESELEEDLELLMQEAEKMKQMREQEQHGDEEVEEALEVTYDKGRNALMCGDYTFERWAPVTLSERAAQTSASGDWCITAIGPLEVTLRNIEGTRTKVSLAALRSRRVQFAPLGSEPA
mmetsp:Transcript_4780/g.13254  ORF Transcript_4780/g.13254 Transcript_4780/m.13254 type:complete len:285 (+) Transcript_4780:101-955(+)